MEYKVYDCNSYRIHTIKTDKFKNCSMEIMFRSEIEKSKITENNMLVDLLMHSSKMYPKRRDVAIALEDLYSSFIRGTCSRFGNGFLISFVTDFLNPKYCEKGYLEKVIDMPFEMLLNPNIENDEFDIRSFNIIKNRIKSDILSIKEQAPRYAMRRSLINMDKDSVSSYSMSGYLEDLDNITPSSLVNTYHNMLNNYVCDIYVIGNLDMNYVVSLIKKRFKNKTIKNDNIPLYVENKTRKVQDIVETGNYEQDSFIMINNLVGLTKRERDYVIHIYNVILGSGGLTSKLYQYLRENNSLCYTASSMYQKYDNLLIIYTGIDKKNKAKCLKLVKKALKEMEDGDFSDEDILNAKKNLISSIKISLDTPYGIVNNYLFNELDGLPLYDERVKEFKTVTKEEVMKLAHKVKLNTVYLLAGGDK